MRDLFPRDTLKGRTAGGRQLVAPVVNEHQVRATAGTTMAVGAVAFAYTYFEHAAPTDVLQVVCPAGSQALAEPVSNRLLPAQMWWGGWDSNPGPADYESAALTG